MTNNKGIINRLKNRDMRNINEFLQNIKPSQGAIYHATTGSLAVVNLIEDQTYLITDCPSNRYNFHGLCRLNENIWSKMEDRNYKEYFFGLNNIEEHCLRALDVFATNDVDLSEYIGIGVLNEDEETTYILIY